MKRTAMTLALSLLVATWCNAAAAAPRKFALLVGVGAYKDAPQLQGPTEDVTAMRAVLVERWGFKPADVQTLLDQAIQPRHRRCAAGQQNVIDRMVLPGGEKELQ